MPNEIVKKKRILHVDDEKDILEVVKTILESEGFEVVSATSGTEALKDIDSGDFDLLILDIMMPDMSGWDLFTRIGKIKSTYKVVFLSILEVSEEKMKTLKDAGVKDYIRKPFEVDDLVARIKKAIES